MHLPEGSLNSSAVLITTAVGILAFGIACCFARRKLCPKQLPSLLAMTIFVCLAQTVNYATGLGYSGHWVGAGLLSIFFGPIAAMLSMAAVLGTQSSLFGDGCWATLGANFINIGIVAPWAAHWSFKLLQGRRSPQVDLGQIIAVGIANFFAIVFAIGATLAGMAGMLIAPITEASLGMGNNVIITAFVVIIVGGIGSVKGALVAALLIGLIDTLGRAFLDDFFKIFMSTAAAENSAPAISSMSIYLIMALILSFKPNGLFPPKLR